jgi:hypothetical protein
VLSSLLGQGFALLTSFDGPGLAGLPLLAEWSAQLDHGGQLLQLLEPDGSLYDGDLGAAVPEGWNETVRDRGQVVVLVGSAIDLGLEDRTERIEAARRAGEVVSRAGPRPCGRPARPVVARRWCWWFPGPVTVRPAPCSVG